jgi:Na+/proline symporter
MHLLDWIVLCGAVAFVVLWSIRKSRIGRSRQTEDIHQFVQSGRDARWFTVALSVMGTQASAITFLSAPGQGYVDGLRFVQFYFGLPLAMIVLCIVVLPLYRTLNVFTAYEYLEQRFDLKTRSLAALLFLTQRSLAAGFTIYAPSIVLSLLLGWNVSLTIVAIGTLVVLYATIGGTKAVSWAQSYQMGIIFVGMAAAFVVIVSTLPVSLGDALHLAGASGKLNTLDWSFDWNNRYTVWSGLLGGFFLQLSYFGTDQSQVQRYLTGQSLTQSRLALLFNGMMKIPMQFAILLLGALVFVFYQFTPPPIYFNTAEVRSLEGTAFQQRFEALEAQYRSTAQERERITRSFVTAQQNNNTAAQQQLQQELNRSQATMSRLRKQALDVLKEHNPSARPNDINYIFLTFVLHYLPVGLVGLVITAILSAAMSSASSEINALASTAVLDVYKRLLKSNANEQHYVLATRLATVGWGVLIILFAQFADRLGSLIEAVNILGSLFYGTILGIFLTAFFVKFVHGTAVFWAAVIAECVVLVLFNTTSISFLWHNLIGCLLVIVIALPLEYILRKHSSRGRSASASA